MILNCINDRKNERMKEDLANSLLFLISPLIIMYMYNINWCIVDGFKPLTEWFPL